MIGSTLELYVAAKYLTILKHLKEVSTLFLILEERQLNYKISKESRVAISSVMGLDNLGSDSRIIILRFITDLLGNSELCWIENLTEQSQNKIS